MPILSILSQPGSTSLNAAYMPIVIEFEAEQPLAASDRFIPPVVYCDIYVNGIFYRTMTSTQPINVPSLGVHARFSFDIQDAMQEVLKPFLPPSASAAIERADSSMVSVFCRLRASGVDTDGFTNPEATAPVQATGSNPAVAGTGTQTNTFYVVNCQLQTEDHTDLAAHLTTFKRTGFTGQPWDTSAYPLTHRPDSVKICMGDNDWYPFVYTGPTVSAGIKFTGLNTNGGTIVRATNPVSLTSGSVYYMPTGPKNLDAAFPVAPVDWLSIKSYSVELVASTGTTILTSNTYDLGCCCTDEKARIQFLNYLGTFDGVNFRKPLVIHEPKSEMYVKAGKTSMGKRIISAQRHSVRSNDTWEAKTDCYGELNMPWLQELADSPLAYMQWASKQGQPDDFLAIFILDKPFEKLKNVNEHLYDFSVTYKLSNDFKNIRT